jgi:hypothetical protein
MQAELYRLESNAMGSVETQKNVSEEHVASIFRAQARAKQETSLKQISNKAITSP